MGTIAAVVSEQGTEKLELIKAELAGLAEVFGVVEDSEFYAERLEDLAKYVAGQLGVVLTEVKPRRAKLTPEQVRSMRAQFKAGTKSMAVLAEEFGCTYSNVSRIVTYKMWNHVQD